MEFSLVFFMLDSSVCDVLSNRADDQRVGLDALSKVVIRASVFWDKERCSLLKANIRNVVSVSAECRTVIGIEC
jgi:hypothetical protein